MTVKEKIITNLEQMIVELEKIKQSLENEKPPGNEEWTIVATLMYEIVNFLPQGTFNKDKDKEYDGPY